MLPAVQSFLTMYNSNGTGTLSCKKQMLQAAFHYPEGIEATKPVCTMSASDMLSRRICVLNTSFSKLGFVHSSSEPA